MNKKIVAIGLVIVLLLLFVLYSPKDGGVPVTGVTELTYDCNDDPDVRICVGTIADKPVNIKFKVENMVKVKRYHHCTEMFNIERFENDGWQAISVFETCGMGCRKFIDSKWDCRGCMCDCCDSDTIYPLDYEINWSKREFINSKSSSSKPGIYRVTFHGYTKDFKIV